MAQIGQASLKRAQFVQLDWIAQPKRIGAWHPTRRVHYPRDLRGRFVSWLSARIDSFCALCQNFGVELTHDLVIVFVRAGCNAESTSHNLADIFQRPCGSLK
jgi:hypothetical protein